MPRAAEGLRHLPRIVIGEILAGGQVVEAAITVPWVCLHPRPQQVGDALRWRSLIPELHELARDPQCRCVARYVTGHLDVEMTRLTQCQQVAHRGWSERRRKPNQL